jgi:hypothetical protein
MGVRNGSLAALAGLALWCAAGEGATAQIVASERGTVRQTIDGTVITVDYSRPSLRGRRDVFNTEVPRNTLWTPGADSATTISFSKDVTIDGTPVPAGRYSVWMVTNRANWQVILDPEAELFHLPHPAPDLDQVVFTVTPDTTAPLVETLAFSFPAVRSTGADLRMHWDRTTVDMTITVRPTRILTVTEEEASPYLGRYAVVARVDSAGTETHEFETELTWANDHLAGTLEFGPSYPAMDIYYAPAAEHVFNPVWVMNGTVAGVIDVLFFEFAMDESGRAVSFELRGPEDELILTGSRIGP